MFHLCGFYEPRLRAAPGKGQAELTSTCPDPESSSWGTSSSRRWCLPLPSSAPDSAVRREHKVFRNSADRQGPSVLTLGQNGGGGGKTTISQDFLIMKFNIKSEWHYVRNGTIKVQFSTLITKGLRAL